MQGPHWPLARMRQDFKPALATTMRPLLAIATKCLKTSGVQPGERLFRIADGAIFIGIGIFHQNRAGAIRAQTRTEAPFALPCALVVAANLRPRHINSATAGPRVRSWSHNLPAGFVSSVISRTLQQKLHSPQAFPGIASMNSSRQPDSMILILKLESRPRKRN